MRPTPPAQRAPGARSTHEGQRTALSGAAWRRALRMLMLMRRRVRCGARGERRERRDVAHRTNSHCAHVLYNVSYISDVARAVCEQARRPPARPPDIIVNKRAARRIASERARASCRRCRASQSAVCTAHAPRTHCCNGSRQLRVRAANKTNENENENEIEKEMEADADARG